MLNYQGIAESLKNSKYPEKINQHVKQAFDMSVFDVHNSGKSYAGCGLNP